MDFIDAIIFIVVICFLFGFLGIKDDKLIINADKIANSVNIVRSTPESKVTSEVSMIIEVDKPQFVFPKALCEVIARDKTETLTGTVSCDYHNAVVREMNSKLEYYHESLLVLQTRFEILDTSFDEVTEDLKYLLETRRINEKKI